MAEKKNEIIRKARKEMNYLTGEAAERRMQELRERWEMDYNSDIGEAKEEGIKEGKNEKVLEIAKKMLNYNMDLDEIVKITGIEKEKLEKIKNSDKR